MSHEASPISTSSNVVSFRPTTPSGPLKFSDEQRAALLAFGYRYKLRVSITAIYDEIASTAPDGGGNGDEVCALMPDGGGDFAVSAHPIKGGVTQIEATDGDIIAEVRTVEALVEALEDELYEVGIAERRARDGA